jgi:membrane protein implicated in regulation of membrane protease activity
VLLIASIVGLFVLPGPWNVIGVCVAAVVEVGELLLWKRFLDRYRVQGGAEGMIGERAEVIESCNPRGRVKLRGEIWAAEAGDGQSFGVGERVRVVDVDGLVLRLAAAEPLLNSARPGA